ncbi:LPXTG cell wall anchor domain-containing protein [Candidatus Enterococcus murrayae]|uniref:LPXTG cell wall anchor domain-containing protein n=1 Tax=Candidatus Enterococcus murrayae TaxID=2815321 RepID=A0ABS3HD26_9ENTE|nr:LPXTG cell wall anchor domain-containing protein [Enterococcus sp. MJM16]MBO0451345.1 LPXTG cell wall anchor domain-containing protein [Enterococcus sp. MJM16]
MKRLSVIVSLALLGFLLAASPVPAKASTSNAESETTIQLSGWGDEAEDTKNNEASGSNTANLPKTGGSRSTLLGKVLPKTGELLSSKLFLSGMVLVLGILFFVFKKRSEEETNEAQNF